MVRSKIGYKLIFAVSFVVTVAMATFSYFIIDSQYNELISQIKISMDQLTETVKRSTRHDMLLDQREEVHRIINTIGDQEGVERVRIFNKLGQIMLSSDQKEMGTMVNKQGEACYACHAADAPLTKLAISERTRIFTGVEGIRHLGIINPIYNERSCWEASCHAHDEDQEILGVLDITMSLEHVDQQIGANQIKMIIFALAVIVAVSLLLGFLVRKLVGNPVREMVEATNRVAQGDLAYKIKLEQKDELGNLARSFNEMTEKLSVAQRQVVQQDKLASLGRLAAGVAHEINNPLTGVLTYGSFLYKRAKEGDEAKADLAVIVRETKRCREIVKGLLDFARQVPSTKRSTSINDVIIHALTIVSNQLVINNVEVHKDLREDLPFLSADANQMQQVFVDLIVNSVDAMGETGGDLSITTDVEEAKGEKTMKITFSDTGHGISPEDQSKIFDPFFTTKGQSGTGLGLAVVWGIVNEHGGVITVESEAEKGTTFTLRFPLKVGGDSTPLIKETT